MYCLGPMSSGLQCEAPCFTHTPPASARAVARLSGAASKTSCNLAAKPRQVWLVTRVRVRRAVGLERRADLGIASSKAVLANQEQAREPEDGEMWGDVGRCGEMRREVP